MIRLIKTVASAVSNLKLLFHQDSEAWQLPLPFLQIEAACFSRTVISIWFSSLSDPMPRQMSAFIRSKHLHGELSCTAQEGVSQEHANSLCFESTVDPPRALGGCIHAPVGTQAANLLQVALP